MKKILSLLILILSSSSVFASEWINIGPELYLDKSSIRYYSKNRTYKAWLKEVTPQEIILSFNEYNMKDKEWRNLDTVTMSLQNKVKKRDVKGISEHWLNVVPDSNSSIEYDAIKKEIYQQPELKKSTTKE